MVDEQTFVKEAQAMERTLYRVSRGYLSSWEDCADAVQEALTKAWAKRQTVEPEHFRAWLTRIVINECHNVYRRGKRITLVADVELPLQPMLENSLALRESLSALPEKLRIPLLLHYLEGFSLEDVSRILRLPMGTVKSRLHHARKAMKNQLEQEDDGQ
ncbi:MAG: RNA polymerase sigma factor [Clostridia bacterium]